VQALELPYRVVNIAASDLGASAAKKYDVEGWFELPPQTSRTRTAPSLRGLKSHPRRLTRGVRRRVWQDSGSAP
jgi:seryl-tRNA synthetase